MGKERNLAALFFSENVRELIRQWREICNIEIICDTFKYLQIIPSSLSFRIQRMLYRLHKSRNFISTQKYICEVRRTEIRVRHARRLCPGKIRQGQFREYPVYSSPGCCTTFVGRRDWSNYLSVQALQLKTTANCERQLTPWQRGERVSAATTERYVDTEPG